jgi:hypothetical protein
MLPFAAFSYQALIVPRVAILLLNAAVKFALRVFLIKWMAVFGYIAASPYVTLNTLFHALVLCNFFLAHAAHQGHERQNTSQHDPHVTPPKKIRTETYKEITLLPLSRN